MRMKSFFHWAGGTALAIALAWPAAADIVRIRIAPGGIIMLSGTIVSADDQFLTLNTKSGIVRVPRGSAYCDGDACPGENEIKDVATNPREASIVASETIGNEVLLSLIQGYAASESATIKMELDQVGRKLISKLQFAGGDEQSVKLGLDNSAAAFSQLLRGDANLALTTRQMTNQEASAFVSAGLGDPRTEGRETVVALDALVMATSPDNPLANMSLEDAVQVVAGRMTNWSELGGADAPIELLLPSATSEAFQGFSEEIMRPLRLRPSTTPGATLEKADLAQRLSNSPGAIGLTTLSGIGAAKPIPLRLACGLLAQPDLFSVKAEDYPLTRRVYLYSRDPNPEGITRAIYEFATSPEGKAQFAKLGYIDQTATALPVEEQGLRFLSAIMSQTGADNLEQLQMMASQILSAERLSMTFRFDSTGAALDSRGKIDVARLADILRGRSADIEVILLGFTDNVGRGEINQLVAKDRAELVRLELLDAMGGRLAPENVSALGLGSSAPVACNTNVSGRQANRRVEVWVKG